VIVEVSKSVMSRRLDEAKHGQWLMYHVGFLMDDRTKNRNLHSIAKMLMTASEEKRAALVQRRLGFRMYEYYVVKV
jgi:hypothetical protein